MFFGKICSPPSSDSPLKGLCQEIFASGFFHESFLSAPLRLFKFFQKFAEIFAIPGHHRWQIATGLNDTGSKVATGRLRGWQTMGAIIKLLTT
jgi:hypothetical protein